MEKCFKMTVFNLLMFLKTKLTKLKIFKINFNKIIYKDSLHHQHKINIAIHNLIKYKINFNKKITENLA